MKNRYKILIAAVSGLICTQFLQSQELPSLPPDQSITKGFLPNGMAYYLVSNPSAAGMADFALVRKDGAVERKRNVLISESESVLDSTLLSVMRTADHSSPADQAVIVAGDIDTEAVAGKIKMLSYMTPVKDTVARQAYEWRSVEGVRFVASECKSRDLAVVTVTWASPRIPVELMNTIQPSISSLFVGQLGVVAKERISLCLKQAGIPATDVGYSHMASYSGPGDEKFSISASVAPQHMETALRIMAFVMSSLDSGSVTVQEVKRANAEYLRDLYESSTGVVNDRAVSRCISSFLYNDCLASHMDIYRFHSSRDLEDGKRKDLFCAIAAALLDKEDNVTIECVSPQLPDSSSVVAQFAAAWDRNSGMTWKDRPEASSFLVEAVPEKKTKIAAPKMDPMSGGNVFVLDNGVTVISRNMPADGRIYYSLALNGGYADIPSLAPGEGTFATDYLASCRVAGVSGKDFRDALAADGITMEFDIDLKSTIVYGSASRFDLAKVFQALTALAGSREQDADTFASLMKNRCVEVEAMKGTYAERMAAVEAMMCPEYEYSAIMSSGVTDEFTAKAERFLSGQFAKMNDGVLVLTGEISESVLKKELAAYGPLFKTSQKAFSYHSLHYQPISGVSSSTVAGETASMDLAMTARFPLTSDNFAASRVALLILRDRMAKVFDGTGWNVSVQDEFTIHPDERINVVVSLTEDLSEGTAAWTSEEGQAVSQLEALFMLRSALSDIKSADISEDLFNACRDHVKGRMELRQKDADYWAEAISNRFLFGKDMNTGFAERCEALTVDKVRNVLSALEAGGKVEYVVTR